MNLRKALDELVHPPRNKTSAPLIKQVHETVRNVLDPGGTIYNKYVHELRLIISRSESNDVLSNIKNQAGKMVQDADGNIRKSALADLHVISIETQPITDRCQIGLITGDGYSVKIKGILPDGRKIEFGWFPEKKIIK